MPSLISALRFSYGSGLGILYRKPRHQRGLLIYYLKRLSLHIPREVYLTLEKWGRGVLRLECAKRFMHIHTVSVSSQSGIIILYINFLKRNDSHDSLVCVDS